MYQHINENVQVLVSFMHDKVQPLVFRWGNRTYKIKKVHLVHVNRQGKNKIYHFSVTDNANYFKLSFHPDNMQWVLSERYVNV
ncbi:MAG TPA: hypothetical protein VJA22_02420 [Patescibacteria group bacterium]|nr:hypothetical protein [Patescibacteria group bacterium]